MKKLPYILVALSLGSAVAVSAQSTETSPGSPRGPRGHKGHHRGGHPIVRALDTDKNRELSATELSAATASLRALDTNSDGTVSREELHPGHSRDASSRLENKPGRPADATTGKSGRGHYGERMVGARGSDPLMLALDANSDGALSDTELTNATTSLTALDLNKDGKLTVDELRPLPPKN